MGINLLGSDSLDRLAWPLLACILIGQPGSSWGGGSPTGTNLHSHLAEFSFTRLSSAAPGYATAQSHNQLIVSNSKGIFLAYLDSYQQDEVSRNFWTLLRSVDDGKTFSVLHRAHGVSAPTVETDEEDNIYVFAPGLADPADPSKGQLKFYKFTSSSDFRNPLTSTIPLDKYVDRFTAIYDRARRQFYFFPYLDVPFLTLDMTGKVVASVRLFTTGPNALLEYPHMAMDGGRLFLAWTTATPVKPWRYYSIHAMVSDDGGRTWTSPATGRLELPIASDDTGPIPPIGREAWLANFKAADGVLHYMYLSGTREVYRRVPGDVADPGVTAEAWQAGGLGIHSVDGFFTVHRKTGAIYAVGTDYRQSNAEGFSPIVVLRSNDNGKSWHAHAKSPALYHPYAVGGTRYSWDDGGLIGIFTYFKSWDDPPSNEAYFFRVPF